MTPLDAVIKQLDAAGWRIWHVGQRSSRWQALLFTEKYHPAIMDAESRIKGGMTSGFSKQGVGATMLTAVRDAAENILPAEGSETIDLDDLLG